MLVVRNAVLKLFLSQVLNVAWFQTRCLAMLGFRLNRFPVHSLEKCTLCLRSFGNEHLAHSGLTEREFHHYKHIHITDNSSRSDRDLSKPWAANANGQNAKSIGGFFSLAKVLYYSVTVCIKYRHCRSLWCSMKRFICLAFIPDSSTWGISRSCSHAFGYQSHV